MQSSKDGVIIFSLGSYCLITEQTMADMFAEAFSQVPQKVIWKRRGKTPPKVPENVKFMDVIPQNDLLGRCCPKQLETALRINFSLSMEKVSEFGQQCHSICTVLYMYVLLCFPKLCPTWKMDLPS